MTTVDQEVKRLHRGALKHLIATQEWAVLREYLQAFREVAIINLLSTKEKAVSDDFIRGQIKVFDYLLRGLAEQLDDAEQEELEQMRLDLDGGPPVDRGDPYGEPTSPESE